MALRRKKFNSVVQRHSFTSIANDLSFTEATISVLADHSRDSITSLNIHMIDGELINAADSIVTYIKGMLGGHTVKHARSAVDRDTRENTFTQFVVSQADIR